MTWLRLIALAFGGMLLLFFLLIGLVLFTSQGNQMLWAQAERMIPGLHGELVSGHLGRGWEFKELGFSSPELTFTSGRVKLVWLAGGLLSGKLVVDELNVEQLKLDIATSSAGSVESLKDNPDVVSSPTFIRLPLGIELRKLSVAEFFLHTHVVDVRVDSLQAAASWQGEAVTLLHSQASGVDVHLLSEDRPATQQIKTKAPPVATVVRLAKPFDAEAVRKSIESLPSVFLPIRLAVNQFTVTDGRYHQDGFDTGLFNIKMLTGAFSGEDLHVEKLDIAHALGDLSLDGKMRFHDYYPMTFQLRAASKLPWLDGQLKGRAATLQVTGPLTDLRTRLVIEGEEKLQLDARLNTLAEQLPFDFSAKWHQLSWPLKGKAEYQLTSGDIKSAGTLDKYHLQLNSQVKALTFPSGKIHLSLDGTLEDVKLNPLLISSGSSELSIAGSLSWLHQVKWQGIIKGHSANIHEWVPEVSGRLAGQIDTRFELKDKQWSLMLPRIDVNGQLNGYPLSLTGNIKGNDKLQWQVSNLLVRSGNNQLSINGSLGTRWQLDGALNAPELGIFYPELSGDVVSTFSLAGSATAPQFSWNLEANKLNLATMAFRDIHSKGVVKRGKLWSGDGQILVGRIRNPSLRLENASVKFDGDEHNHQLSVSFDGKPVAMQLNAHGSLVRGRWQGSIEKSAISSVMGAWVLQQPMSIASRSPWQQFSLGRGCWRSQKAELCLGEGELGKKSGKLPIALSHFETSRLHPFMPERLAWESVLEAQGVVGWNGRTPSVDLTLQTDAGKIKTDEITSSYELFGVKIKLDDKSGQLALNFESPSLGKAKVDLHIDDPEHKRQLSGDLSLTNLRLYGVAPMFDELRRTKGRIDAQGRFAGVLDKPLFYGQLRLSEGEIDTSAEIATVRQLVTVVNIDGAKAEVDGSMMVGKGKLTLGGFIDWSAGAPVGTMTVDADTLEVGLAGYGRARVSAHLISDIGQALNIRGRVYIPWARIKVKDLPESIVSVSDDVEIVRPRQQSVQKAPPIPVLLDITLALGGDVKLDAFGLKTQLVGGLHMTQSPDKPFRSDGEIRLEDGRFKAYGQNLLIEEGSLLFSGNVSEPFLKITAQRDPETMEDKSITVGVKVTGPASQPKIEIYSEPQLSETEKLSYLLRGKGTGTGMESSNDDAMAGLLIGAGLSQAGGVVSGVAESLGFSDVSLDSKGSGDDTQVIISGYLMPKVQLQYGVGVFTAINEVTLRYELFPRLYLQAMTGLAQAIDIFYKFEF